MKTVKLSKYQFAVLSDWLRQIKNELKELVASSDERNRILERALKPVVQDDDDQEAEE